MFIIVHQRVNSSPADILLGCSSTSRAGTEFLVGSSHYSSKRSSTLGIVSNILISAHHDVVDRKYA
jgi:hypothetical protein